MKKSKTKLVLFLVLLFSIFMASIPRLLYFQIPCLDNFNTKTVDYSECNLILVSNMYIIYGLIGYLAVLIIFSLKTKLKYKKELILLGVISMAVFLVGYYTYLPHAEASTLESDIYLDTFYEEYGQP